MSGTKSGTKGDKVGLEAMSPRKQSFGIWLKQRRATLDLTQKMLAVQAGCSARTIRQIEANHRRPSHQLAVRMALALELPQTVQKTFVDFARGKLMAVPSALDTSAELLSIRHSLFDFHPLPVPVTSLIGRDDIVASLSELLLRADVHLLTLIGPPGVGKTRLGIQVASNITKSFRADACFVELAAVHDNTQVVPAIAAALGLREEDSRPLIETVIGFLSDNPVLLVLDNFEQVITEASSITQLLTAARGLKVLITSRIVLHIAGEQMFSVPALPLPNLNDEATLDSLAQSPAVMLFIQRARAVNHALVLNEEQMWTIAKICTRLDGLPLAIELAAARMNVLSPDALFELLDQRLDFLHWNVVDRAPHHQALRAAILWSYELLKVDEQILFRRLGVFAGGCTLEAVQAVCSEGSSFNLEGKRCDQTNQSPINTLDSMSLLVDHSLVQQTTVSGEPRFKLLESLRAFALEQLETSGEIDQVRRSHAEYYLCWVEHVFSWLQYPDQQTMERLDVEYENCKVAIKWSLASEENKALGLRLVLVFYSYWRVRGFLSEGRQWLQAAITRNLDQKSMLLARAQACAAELARLQDHYKDAEGLAKASWFLAQSLNDQASMALSLVPLGWIDYTRNDLASARQKFESSLQLFQGLGNYAQVTIVLHDLAYLAMVQGNYDKAMTYYDEELRLSRANHHQLGSFWALHGMAWHAECCGDFKGATRLYKRCLTLAHELGHVDGVAVALNGLGTVARYEGKYSKAMVYYQQSQRVWRRLGRKAAIALTLQEQGYVALHQDATEQSAALFAESLGVAYKLGRTRSIAPSLSGLAAVACALGKYEQTVRLLSATVALLAASGNVLEPINQKEFENSIAATQTHLDARMFDQEWATGQKMELKEAIAEGTSLATSVALTRSGNMFAHGLANLTKREVDVLRLVAQGLTNAQIATELLIGQGTVNTHLTHLYRKLKVSSRALATRIAIEQGLV